VSPQTDRHCDQQNRGQTDERDRPEQPGQLLVRGDDEGVPRRESNLPRRRPPNKDPSDSGHEKVRIRTSDDSAVVAIDKAAGRVCEHEVNEDHAAQPGDELTQRPRERGREHPQDPERGHQPIQEEQLPHWAGRVPKVRGDHGRDPHEVDNQVEDGRSDGP
jgi:hypothetical protein